MTTQRLIHEEKPAPSPMPKDPIMEAICALTDPIIVFPGTGWEQDIPKAQKDRVPIERMLHQMLCLRGKAEWNEATDLEAMLYLFPASLAAPMGSHWTRIYLYLGTQCLPLPEDIQEKTLDNYEMGMLRDLKRWIYHRRVEHRKERRRVEKAEAVQDSAPAEPVEAKYEQLSLM